MKTSEIATIVDGIYFGNQKKIKSIKTNSKDLNKNDLFIALKGTKFDGHDFISNKYVSISEKKLNNNVILVKDTYQALLKLSKYLKEKTNPKVIAITGSVGKTMTKELISAFLSTKYKVLKTSGNMNNHFGIPLTMLKITNEDFLVLEMGMNHKKEISNLSKLVNPDLAVITNIGSSHIGNLKNKKNIFASKLEILDGMNSNNLVVNGDDKYLKRLKCNKCGLDIKNDLYAYNIYTSLKRTTFSIKIANKEYTIRTIPGKHLITNILLAIKVALIYNIDIKDMITIIENYIPMKHRMNIIEKQFTIIDDCYNSSYESLIGVLKLIKRENKKSILIIGDILELGHKTKYYYKKISRYLKTFSNANVLLVGNNIKIMKKFKYFATNQEVIKYLQTIKLNENIILVKGSRLLQLEEIVNYLIEF